MKNLGCLLLLFLTIAFAMPGCSLFSNQIDQAAEGAGKLVTFYCKNVTDPAAREEFRAAVNAQASPHSVTVTCAQGGEVLRTAPVESAAPAT